MNLLSARYRDRYISRGTIAAQFKIRGSELMGANQITNIVVVTGGIRGALYAHEREEKKKSRA